MTAPAALHPGPDAASASSTGSGGAVWLRLLVATGCQALLGMLVSLALWGAVPAVLGWHPTTVSSGSMMPRLHVGDVAVSKPLSAAPVVDQVLLFTDPDHPAKLRLHRFVRVDDQGRLVTRGDANRADDSTPVTLDAVRGVAVLRVPYVASPVVWLREGQYLPLALVAGALVLLGFGAGLGRDLGFEEDGVEESGEQPDGTEDADEEGIYRATPERVRWTRAARVAPAAAALVVALALAWGAFSLPAWASYAANTKAGVGTLAASDYYSCENAVLANNPYLYYPMDETGGSTARDASGNGRNGTYQGSSSVGSSDVCDSSTKTAVVFNGTSGYVSTPTLLLAPNTFTVSAWFKTTSTRGGRILGFGSSRTGASVTTDRQVYLTTNGRLVFGVQPLAKQIVTTTGAYNDGSWHLVTASLSSVGMRLYVDGALVASLASATTGATTTGYWRVGYDTLTGWPNAPTSSYFAGSLEQAAVFSTALGADAVGDLYEAGR